MKLLLAVDGSPSRLAPVVLNVQAPPLMLWPEASLDARAVEGALLESGGQQPLTLLETVLPPHRDVIEQWSTREGDEKRASREAALT